jgi:hypothetical protein
MAKQIEYNPTVDIICKAVVARVNEIPGALLPKAYGVLQALGWIVSEIDSAEARNILITDLLRTLRPGVEEILAVRAAQPSH